MRAGRVALVALMVAALAGTARAEMGRVEYRNCGSETVISRDAWGGTTVRTVPRPCSAPVIVAPPGSTVIVPRGTTVIVRDPEPAYDRPRHWRPRRDPRFADQGPGRLPWHGSSGASWPYR